MDRVGGACALLIRDDLQFKVCKWEGTIECVILQVWCIKEIHLVNCFNPNKSLHLAEFVNILSLTGKYVVWVGDFNAYNPLLGS